MTVMVSAYKGYAYHLHTFAFWLFCSDERLEIGQAIGKRNFRSISVSFDDSPKIPEVLAKRKHPRMTSKCFSVMDVN